MQGRNGYFRDENRLRRFRASKPTCSFHEKGGRSPAAPLLVSTPGAPPTRNPAGGRGGAGAARGRERSVSSGSAEPGSLAVQQRLRPTQRPRTAAQPDLTPRHFHVSPPSRLSGRDNREGRAPSAQAPSAHAQVPGAPVSRPRQRRGGRGLGPLRTACRSSNEGVGTDPQARPGRPAAGGALGLPRWVLFWEPRAGGGGEGASIAPKPPNGKGREAGAKRQDLKGGAPRGLGAAGAGAPASASRPAGWGAPGPGARSARRSPPQPRGGSSRTRHRLPAPPARPRAREPGAPTSPAAFAQLQAGAPRPRRDAAEQWRPALPRLPWRPARRTGARRGHASRSARCACARDTCAPAARDRRGQASVAQKERLRASRTRDSCADAAGPGARGGRPRGGASVMYSVGHTQGTTNPRLNPKETTANRN